MQVDLRCLPIKSILLANLATCYRINSKSIFLLDLASLVIHRALMTIAIYDSLVFSLPFFLISHRHNTANESKHFIQFSEPFPSFVFPFPNVKVSGDCSSGQSDVSFPANRATFAPPSRFSFRSIYHVRKESEQRTCKISR